jgi:hypothetical protein
MTWAVPEREAALAVEAMAPAVESAGTGWRFRLGRQPHAPNVDVHVENGWVLLDAPLESAALSQADLAEANGRLRGAVKFALVPEDERIHIRADFPLQVGVDLGAHLQGASRGCELAASLARSGREQEDSASPGRGDSKGDEPVGPVPADELARLCEEAGWVFSERSSGRLAVDLEGTEGFFQAQLRRRADGAVALSVEFEDCHPAASACREATASFLLRCCGWLRMVRAVGASAGKGAAPRFEVVFAVDPSPSELSEALAALSVSVRFCSRELQVLARSEAVARSYLARNPRFVRSAAAKRTRKKAKPVKSGAKGRAAVATGPRTSVRRGSPECPPGASEKPQQPQGEVK